jgi:DNA-binding transcriptional regulator GbsR (MarR family)
MNKLSPVQQKFILHWGEMGTRWGINRTVAQIHALLFLSAKPLHAEEIASTLAVARSNVSNSLRELQGWGVVRVVHVLGDRRDHFESLKNVWEMFRIVCQERKRRELDPTLHMLQECVGDLNGAGAGSAHTRERLEEMLEFLTITSSLFDEVVRLPPSTLKGMARLRGKLKTIFGMGHKNSVSHPSKIAKGGAPS